MPSDTAVLCHPRQDEPEKAWSLPEMEWPEPEFTRGQVRRAGDMLRATDPDTALYPIDWDANLLIINNWRAAHSYPLQAIKMTLLGRAERIAKAGRSKAIVAQRLKRMESIWAKLRLTPRMDLPQMQDIGGCRAILRSVSQVNALVATYEADIARCRDAGPEFLERYDYITRPKPSGYRSFHYAYKYRSHAEHKRVFNGLRIEIQIRSQLQHAWATAVETVSTLTQQALKSNIGTDDWKRFFQLMGTAIALRERTPIIPGTPEDKQVLFDELREIEAKLMVADILGGYGFAVFELTGQERDAAAFLMVLDPVDKTVDVQAFAANELLQAEESYLQRERELDRGKGMQAVLVSAESVSSLKRAYPNYFLDTRQFLDALGRAIGRNIVADSPEP